MSRRFVYLRNVATLAIDRTACVGCGTCLSVCPHEVLALESGRSTVADLDACMECGACSTNCAVGAISVVAGVGCAAAVINSALGRTGADCCCLAPSAASPRQQKPSMVFSRRRLGLGRVRVTDDDLAP